MTTVIVKYQPGRITLTQAIDMVDSLPEIVADALTCDDLDGHLTAEDIDVDLKVMGRWLRSKYDIQITVLANDYPQRKANLDERIARIAQSIKVVVLAVFKDRFDRPKGGLCVRLTPGEFVEF